ncbi:hypothetical protein [Lactococcus termiticola]|uniref:WxL domain-containing protein n=1 Tax=Lactococcus termiticola TaxID=2169526 RepID=A0A2R5HHC5_9LACT|nr:hypothetical protein [Lactococcus termiticola]GBG97382.1 hypothetical protein NtB2_01522 [Lactococcus termiticola]
MTPNNYLRSYYYYGYSGGASNSSGAYPILSSDLIQKTGFTSQSTLTWQPLASVPYGTYDNPAQTGTFWGSTGNYYQHLMLIIPAPGAKTTGLNPVEVNGYDPKSGQAYIDDYFQQTVNGVNVNNVVLVQGNIRQFQIDGSNTTTGAGTWNINPSLSTNSGQNGFFGSGTSLGYASYFDNTVSGTTYNNLAELIYPASSTFSVTNPATFKTISGSDKINFIRHAQVQTPQIGTSPSYVQWEWPASGTVAPAAPLVLSSDSPIYNTNSSYISYAPGTADATNPGEVPDSSADYNYPTAFTSSYMLQNSASSFWGFFPGNFMNGQSVINGNALNPTNWTLPTSNGQNGTSFLIYNVKPDDTISDSGNVTPPTLENPTISVSDAGISSQQEQKIAASSNSYAEIAALLKPTAAYYDGSSAAISPLHAVITPPGGSPVTINYTDDASFSTALSTALSNTANQAVGTKIAVDYSSVNGLAATGTITVEAGSLTASGGNTVTQIVNGYAKDMSAALASGKSDHEIAQDLIDFSGATATTANNATASSDNITIIGWGETTPDGKKSTYAVGPNYTATQLYQQMIQDMSARTIPAGTKFQVTFSAPDGLGGSNSQTISILIIPGSITASNVVLSMQQAQDILKNDNTAQALGTDLAGANTSVGAAGANVKASIGSSTATTSLTNASSVYSWLQNIDKTSSNLQTTTLTFATDQYGVATSVTLTVMPAGVLTLKSVPNIDFGNYTTGNPPKDWSHIPMVTSSTATATVYDSRTSYLTAWQLTVEDDQTGNIFSNGGTIYNQGASANSTAVGALDDYSPSSPENISGTASVVYDNQAVQGGEDADGFETTSITPRFYLSFPGQLAGNLTGQDKLVWTLTNGPGN